MPKPILMPSPKPKKKPIIFGILNVTPDSFSDGGLYFDPQDAIEHAVQLRDDGADVIDVGAVSSHPDAKHVSSREELKRLNGVIKELAAKGFPLSVDSYRSEVQRYALSQKVNYLNDTSAFDDSFFHVELAASKCRLILMHSIQRSGLATRETSIPENVYQNMLVFFEKKLEFLIQNGIDPKRLVLDPGMGFFLGANPKSSIYVFKKMKELKDHFQLPLMISVSRKSFLGEITQRTVTERGPATLSAELLAAHMGVDYIRTHDVVALRDALQVWSTLSNA